MTQCFCVEKTTATPADTFLTFGLAQLLSALSPYGESKGLQINDIGDSFQLELKQPIAEKELPEVGFFVLFKSLVTGKKKSDLPAPFQIDYLEQQRDNQAYFEARKSGMKDYELREQGFRAPAPDWPGWAVINQMSAIGAYNTLNELWYAHLDCFPALIKLILDLYGSRPNPLEEIEGEWKKLAKVHNISYASQMPQLQVVNPGMGKGGNRSKADGLGIGGLRGFWIPEYLKFAGLFQAGIPRTLSGSKDRKTYVVRPKALKWETHRTVFPDFQSSFYSHTAIKMDILATLNYCEVFLKQWKSGQGNGWGKFTRGKPGDHIAALDVIFYKHLGSAHATMNISTLVLPEWLPDVSTTEQADQYLELLAEHRRVIQNLDEKKGDEYELLNRYREFLSAKELRAFYEFARGYSKFIIRKYIAGRYPPRQFTIPNLEVLIMAHDAKLSPILQNEGFLHIANAIRRSTVIPQYQKGQGRDSLYEIRYGLGDKLLRHAHYSDDFIKELSLFMHDYNRENARKSETRKQQFRSNITVQDIADIVQLIDQFGSLTVASLLVAYGYARDPKLITEQSESKSEPEQVAELETELEPEGEPE